MKDFISGSIPVTIDHYLYWIEYLPQDVEDVAQVANFGQHARQRREYLGMSQAVVAHIMTDPFGISWHQTVVAKIESGERQVKLAEALALSKIYGMKLEDLMTGWDLEGNTYLREKNEEMSDLDALNTEVKAAQNRWVARKEREKGD